ncbi:MAG: 2'-5' RNA ligase family protein [archaeon]
MGKGPRYSIQLMPEGELVDELQGIIDDLSDKFSSPKFMPHVTLIGSIKGDKEEIFAKVEVLAKKIKPFDVELGKISYQDEHSRCLFFEAKSTLEYEELLKETAETLKGRFNSESVRHLSILYGDFPEKTKLEAIKDIKISKRSFGVNKIHVWFTAEDKEGWKSIAFFPIK